VKCMDREETYWHWRDRFRGKHIDGKRIVDIRVEGPPSFVYGSIILVLEDGSEMSAPRIDPVHSYRPSIRLTEKMLDENKQGKP